MINQEDDPVTGFQAGMTIAPDIAREPFFGLPFGHNWQGQPVHAFWPADFQIVSTQLPRLFCQRIARLRIPGGKDEIGMRFSLTTKEPRHQQFREGWEPLNE